MKLNLYTVCTGNYPIHYAEKCIKRFKQLSSFDVIAYCITDRPEEVKHFCTPISPKYEVPGWWNKMFCYDPENPAGWNLYLDLDMVLIDSFDEEIKYAIEQDKKIACFRDCLKWHNNYFNSSFMVFKTGSMLDVWNSWAAIRDSLSGYAGGDQVWVGRFMEANNADILYLEEKFRYSKLSLKYQVGQIYKDSQNQPRLRIPENLDHIPVKIVDCSGKPKPCVLVPSVPWVKENWGDV